MSAYASYTDVQERMSRSLTTDEQSLCDTLLEDAAVIINAYNANATDDRKKLCSIRMVLRMFGDGDESIPAGATQGSMSGLGYTSSWTIGSGGSAGELYLGKLEKKLLGCGNLIGSYSPIEG